MTKKNTLVKRDLERQENSGGELSILSMHTQKKYLSYIFFSKV